MASVAMTPTRPRETDARRCGQRQREPGGGWGRLSIRTVEGTTLPGWWRRYGRFVLTVASAGPVAAPAALDARPLLDTAAPSHGWLEQPLR